MQYKKEDTEKIREEILKRISEGESLISLLKKTPALPSTQTVYNWLNSKHTKFSQNFLDRYVRAREIQGDFYFEEVNRIGKETLEKDGHDPDRARVAIDALKWTAGKVRPNKYGDRLKVDMDISEVKPILIKDFEDEKK